MAEKEKPLLIKRYASRRLYNTETSDYVTLEDIAGIIRAGREVQIVDLKSGDDLTRQYLLQIIAEHESRGENVLPVNVLNDLVRSYMVPGGGMMPQFLQSSFEMLRESQKKMVENMTAMNPMAKMPGFEAMQAQQEAFLKAMTGGLSGNWSGPSPDDSDDRDSESSEDLEEIKKQLADLHNKLSKLKESGPVRPGPGRSGRGRAGDLVQRIDQDIGHRVQLRAAQMHRQPHIAGAHQHGAGLRQFGPIRQELPVPEGACVVSGAAEDLHLHTARGGGLGKGVDAGIVEIDQVELD